jgi:RNA polymerase sigma-54 factor
MAISPRLEIRQGQSLVMTPQLQQAIKLLQLSNLELREYVEEELAENPMLERDEGNTASAEEPAAPIEVTDVRANEDAESIASMDMDDYGNVWDDEPAAREAQPSSSEESFADSSFESASFQDWGSGGDSRFSSGDFNLEQTVSQNVSLRDHLLNQINVDITDPVERLIAVYLTDTLDDSGRLSEELDAVAERLGCSIVEIEATLKKLQQLDPPGIFARDLKECWEIQLREKDRLDPAMATLLEHIELMKLHDYAQLSKLCHVDQDDVRDMIDEIASLNHHPARAFDSVLAQPIIPDVIMRPSNAGGWIVELNADALPRVLINQHYYAEVSSAVRTKEERKYVTEKFQSASWLVKSIHQRATTILKVAAELVKQQDAFFRRGVQHLKPLVLRDIADEIEMHESTVSRVTSNKYIYTPRGIFELKYFFTSSIASSDGGAAHSAEAVRHRIKTLIDAEPATDVLSDDKLVELLNRDGIDIARRTVAKYRESMHIPSSVQRRRDKRRAARI